MPAIAIDTISDYLRAAVTKYVSPCLISPMEQSRILALAGRFPAAMTNFFGFESRLGNDRAAADFLICSSPDDAGQAILAGRREDRELPAALLAHPVWARVRDFAALWAEPGSALHDNIQNVWLEFDLEGEGMEGEVPAVPVPSVFFGSERLQAPHAETGVLPPAYEWFPAALGMLLGRGLAPEVSRQLSRSITLLPPGSRIFQAGAMLSRPSGVVRVCVRGISLDDIPGYLERLGWPGPLAQLRELLRDLAPRADRIDLDLDVSDRVLPKLGLECYFASDMRAAQQVPAFIQYLVDGGWCTPGKAAGILQWSGVVHERVNLGGWPSELSAGNGDSAFARWVHHVKITLQPDPNAPLPHPLPCEPHWRLEAKAYLALKLIWISVQNLKQILRDTGCLNESPSAPAHAPAPPAEVRG